MIKAGAAAIHIEDQVGAKRCGHRPGKEIVLSREMADRIKAAADAKTDQDFFASASVRAMMTKSGSVRASTAALMRSPISSANHLLARAVAAALGADLVLDVHGGGAGLDQRARGARHVEGARAEAGVDVDQQRQVADVGDAADVDEHVVQVGDAEVRHAERAGGDAAAGKVDRAVADALRHQRVVGVDRADDLERLFVRGLPEARARAGSSG